MEELLLTIDNLSVTVREEGQDKLLVNDISLTIPKNSIVGLVGGSGSGKTTTGLSIMRLLPMGLKLSKGNITFNKLELLKLDAKSMRQLRGKEIAMVFQEPLYAFNPVFTIGYQINEVLKYHTDLKHRQRKEKICDLLKAVGLENSQQMSKTYPHQLSGGMRQRAMIAQAIAASPKLIIADEPTSNLDVTLQANVMQMFRELKEELGISFLLITHDLGMARNLSEYIFVMKEGQIVESGKTSEIMSNPKDEYTKALMKAF